MANDTLAAAAIDAIKEKMHSAILELEQIPAKRQDLDRREKELNRIVANAKAAGELFGVELETPDDVIRQSEHSAIRRHTENQVPTIRELTVEWLKTAGDSGIKAATIRQQIESKYHINLHDKTVGMTLWRLSQDGLARREGHTWFFVPPTAETENPGGEAPGSNSPSSGKEEA